MLLNNQCISQRNHEKYTQQTTKQSDNRNFNNAWLVHSSLCCPKEQRRKGKYCTRCNRLTCRAYGLYNITFQNRVFAHYHANHTHCNNSSRNGCGNCHTYSKSQVCVGCTKYNSKNNTHHNGCHCKFRGNLIRWNIRLKFFLLVHKLLLSLIFSLFLFYRKETFSASFFDIL